MNHIMANYAKNALAMPFIALNALWVLVLFVLLLAPYPVWASHRLSPSPLVPPVSSIDFFRDSVARHAATDSTQVRQDGITPLQDFERSLITKATAIAPIAVINETQATFNEKLKPPLPTFKDTLTTAKPSDARISSFGKINAVPIKSASPQINQSRTEHALPNKKRQQIHPTIAPNAPITLEFQKAELTAVLQAFANFTGLNIIASQQVHGTVSLQLDQVPWRRALDLLLKSHGLAMQQRGNMIWVAPSQEIAQREKQHLETQARAAELEPLTTHIFELRYQRAEDIHKLLSGSGTQRILSKRGVMMADVRTNQLFVTDLAENVQQIQTLLTALDRPIRQVSIEARIVEAEQGFSRTLGAKLSLLGMSTGTGDIPTSNTLPPRRFITASNGSVYDLPAAPLAGFNAAAAGATLFGASASRVIALELSMLEADGRGQLLSSPRVVTADRAKALIEQGTELPYQAKVGNGVSGVQFRRAGLKLEVTPQITPNGHVILDIDVSKDSVGAETASGPAINTKHVQTQVQVENGGTVAIGGIFTQDQRTDIVRVPGLGNLPLIGALFRRSVKSDRKSELLVFITPNVVTSTSN